MDARTVFGFLIFMGLAAIVHWLIIDAIFKADRPANGPEQEGPPSPKAVGPRKSQPALSQTGPFTPLHSPKPDQPGQIRAKENPRVKR